ncbi:MAG: PTS sugar transporter subunit IIA [Deltaproteobacteria bacterium]|nr:PTS sugar transporter subunit IIA [Deltaproteobacteria bacterium]
MELNQKARKNSLMLCHYLSPSHILLLPGKVSKETVIDGLLERLCELSHLKDVESVKKAVWDREKEGRTVLENGLAIPHARVPNLDELKSCLAIIPESYLDPVENVRVNEVFLFLSPQDHFEAHLQMLAKISRVFQDPIFIDNLLKVATPEDAFTLIQRQERV